MKSLDQFISDWTGKGIDYDGAYGFQCVDLYRQYVKECLGFPQSPAVPGAKDIWNTTLTNFTKIANTPDGVPQKGDVMIWGSVYGQWGHVAVVTEATVNTFKCFSQNDPIGALPAIRWYKNYTGVIGWLRPKGVNLSDPKIEELQKQLDEANLHKSNLQTQVNGLLADIKKWETKYEECNTQRIEAGTSSDGFRSQLNALVAQLATKLGTRQEVPEIMATIDTLITYEDKATELEKKLAKEESNHKQAVDTLEAKIKTLESNLESLKSEFKVLKDTQVAPSKLEPKYSIFEYIVNLFRR